MTQHPSVRLDPVSPHERPLRLIRLVRLALLLFFQPSQVSMSRVTRELKISRRTLFRDLESLRRAGFPVEFDRTEQHYRIRPISAGEDGEWAPIPGEAASEQTAGIFECSSLRLSWEETVAVLAAFRSVSIPPGTEWREHLERAQHKLADSIRALLGSHAESVHRHAELLLSRSHLSLESLRSCLARVWSKTPASPESG